jgi:hypothetical protein
MDRRAFARRFCFGEVALYRHPGERQRDDKIDDLAWLIFS